MQHFLALIVLVLAWCGTAAAQTERSVDELFPFERDKPAVGFWVGTVTTSEGREIFACLSIKQESGWEATITALAGGLLDSPCDRIEAASGHDFAFSIKNAPGSPRFQGAVSEDGQVLEGVTVGDEPGKEGSFRLQRRPRATDLDEPLAFSGELSAQGMTIPLTIVLARTPGGHWVGHLDIPMQRLREFPFVNFAEEEDGTITADLPVPGGAAIEVRLDELRQTLTGTFRQAGLEFDLDLKREPNYTYRDLVRPQTPQPPFPYEAREVSAPHPDGFSLGGTLTLPDPEEFGPGPYPAAVLISGSGQQDRNESILGHEPFLILADYLSRRGIAVMRYDDRGVGASAVEDATLVVEATSSDFATDVLAVVDRLRSIEEIDAARIGLIGHSEGGLIAPMVAERTDGLAFLVLLAGPGVRGDALLLKQSALLLAAAGVEEEAIAAQSVIREKLFAAVLADDEEAATKHLRTLIEAELRSSGAELSPEDVQMRVDAAAEQLLSPWMRYFLSYDPQPALREVACPILALNGTLDLQVWHEQNLDAIERVRNQAGLPIVCRRYEGLNHLFQPAKTGSVAEYVQIETTLDERVLADIAAWILEVCNGSREDDENLN